APDRTRACGPGGPRTPRSRRALPRAAPLEQPGDRLGKLLPHRAALPELPLAPLRQLVDPSPSPRLGGRPASDQEARVLETVQHRVDRPLRELERTRAPPLDLLDDGIAVRGARRQRREHDHVEMPLEHLPFHERRYSPPPELLLQPRVVDDVPVLGEL